jgi:hypothetical protein
MNLGEEKKTYVVEPLENPVPQKEVTPVEKPLETPVEVPAGG